MGRGGKKREEEGRETYVSEGCVEFLGDVEEGEAVVREEDDGEDEEERDNCNILADAAWQRGEARSCPLQKRRFCSRGRDWLGRRWHALDRSYLWHEESHGDRNDIERQWYEAASGRISQE